jgi:para-aminobenzoate synthetase component 1
VRNDLSRIAQKGSVNVDELFGIYEFAHVFQMISTISASLREDITFTDILKSLFPAGSMTGAPKISAMKIIEETESFKRGLFSGTVGYIAPTGDFDFNVVIRSILYNEETKTALIPAGGALTVKCNALDEYNECLLKARANLNLLELSWEIFEKAD